MDILFIGHSLVEFFDWQARFPDHRAANLGVAGESVEGLLARIGKITAAHPTADLIVLMTGLNNLAMGDFEFFGPYREVIGKLKAAYPSARIIANSMLPVEFEFISNTSIKDANVTLKELAREEGVEFLDIYDLFVDAEGRPSMELLADDGVHLSERGYEVWCNALDPVIQREGQRD